MEAEATLFSPRVRFLPRWRQEAEEGTEEMETSLLSVISKDYARQVTHTKTNPSCISQIVLNASWQGMYVMLSGPHNLVVHWVWSSEGWLTAWTPPGKDPYMVHSKP